ncbi:DsbA family protein [Sphingomonas qilianensis]|uniref:DsbA family protein n=1 Tax=Sphingomonas qilianensis TaxID=1736690 RepID=A0ABU9XST8_9SPHN
MKRHLLSAAALLAMLAGAGIGPRAAAAAAITKTAILEDPVAPKVAPKGYDITIVAFADYNCPYCRQMHPVVAALIASDKKIRLVYRDWPIFGPASVEAARAAIASQWQGKHAAFNAELNAGIGKLDSAAIRTAAGRAGVNWPRLQADLVRHKTAIDGLLARTNEQAPALGLQGTPAFIVGPYLLPGARDLATLRKAVVAARKNPAGPPQAR